MKNTGTSSKARRYSASLGCLLLLAVFGWSAFFPEPAVARNRSLEDQGDLSCGTVLYGPRSISTQICCRNARTPGITKPRGSRVLFTPALLKSRKAKTTKAKKKWRQIHRSGKAFCAANYPPPSPTPSPSPSPDPDDNPFVNFDLAGNVTEEGKNCFGIPSDLEANRFIGQTLVNNNCIDCHDAKVGRKFACLRTEIAKAPMFFTSLDYSDQDLAHITAYLMRFATIACPQDACMPR